ncbi:MAG TPA: helix-turn-helix transcriptional regulator [Tepidisphaeraceae bacterium]|nr:helix-turn-helix transcriptional regulator [Tepidisphaeraceae bacterium]
MANLKTTFGQCVRLIRRERHLTQEELARLIHVDYKHLGAIERGIKAPSFELVERIAKVLKVQHYQLFLPVTQDAPDIEADLRSAVESLSRSRRDRIGRFFQEVLRLLKSLE